MTAGSLLRFSLCQVRSRTRRPFPRAGWTLAASSCDPPVLFFLAYTISQLTHWKKFFKPYSLNLSPNPEPSCAALCVVPKTTLLPSSPKIWLTTAASRGYSGLGVTGSRQWDRRIESLSIGFVWCESNLTDTFSGPSGSLSLSFRNPLAHHVYSFRELL